MLARLIWLIRMAIIYCGVTEQLVYDLEIIDLINIENNNQCPCMQGQAGEK